MLVAVAVVAMGFLTTKGPLAGAERGDESPQRRGEAPRHTDRQPDGREVVVVTKAAQRGKRMCVWWRVALWCRKDRNARREPYAPHKLHVLYVARPQLHVLRKSTSSASSRLEAGAAGQPMWTQN